MGLKTKSINMTTNDHVTVTSLLNLNLQRQPREFEANERYTVADQSFDTTTSNA